uniref:Ribosomal protein n=1 Tax=Choreocolax polysiphoniae TaxID=282351 RepID=A0A0B5VUI4_9FLOR|nr:50S ribosomal protein L1 [Choreocolax polysiphoniae]AJH65843.1 50S ribosomal protein L1 [Choreocolax polysiphoniae]
MAQHSRRFLQILYNIDKSLLYNLDEALVLLKKYSSVKFIETVEAHISLNLDPKYANQQLRATIILPKSSKKLIRVAVITQEDKIFQAKLFGADVVGSKNLIEEIFKGRLDFDQLIITPDMMLLAAKLSRVLGPKNLMPSPKSGTVTNEIKNAISEFKLGRLEYKLDRNGILHVPIGKLNFSINDIKLNLTFLQKSIDRNKPIGSKKKYWKSLYLSSTMGPGILINLNSLKSSKTR